MVDIYYNKYKHYKKKYIAAKSYDFFLYQATSSTYLSTITRINAIINSGYIKPGSQLDPKYRVLAGSEPLKDIFCNIYFPDIQNLSSLRGDGIIIHPQLVYDRGCVFNKGWQGGPYTIRENGITINKIEEIKKWLVQKLAFEKTKPAKSNGIDAMALPDYMHHEVLFDEPIPLKYIIGFVCLGCPKHETDKIHNLLKQKGLDIQIFTDTTILNMDNYIR